MVQISTKDTDGVSAGYFIRRSTESLNDMGRIHGQRSGNHLVEQAGELTASNTGDHFAEMREKLLHVHRGSFFRL
uniref:Uncharacterized protein n=1 Tax=Pseudomonas syringae TaxID=317 RepID=O52159_PSESX|nr:unknown protein [Pseudomonas syringae]